MMDNAAFIKDIITERVGLNIVITNNANEPIGVLKPITNSVLNDAEIIAKLTKWRNQTKKFFLTQFNATEERTKKWLSEVVLLDYSRLLFLVYSPKRLIGQCGFKNLSATTVEIDNLMRGEIGGDPHLIFYSEKALIRWLFHSFDIESVFGVVLADNLLALNMHDSVGFRQTELIQLQKIEHDGEVQLQIGNAIASESEKTFARKIELDRSEFFVKENISETKDIGSHPSSF